MALLAIRTGRYGGSALVSHHFGPWFTWRWHHEGGTMWVPEVPNWCVLNPDGRSSQLYPDVKVMKTISLNLLVSAAGLAERMHESIVVSESGNL